MTRIVVAAVVAVAIGGCGRAPADPAGRRETAPPDAAAGRVQQAAAQPAAIELDGQGLGPELRFGAARAQVVGAATSQFGPPTASDRLEECGEGALDFVRFGGLSLSFQDGRLAGWFVRSPFQHKTAAGLGVGDPRSALGATQVKESTLGEEFSTASGVNGILGNGGQEIEALWAGSACLFR